MSDLITVVIPVYNVEQYLDRCLKSITRQTYINLEILLVDDGSTDSCPVRCDQWAKKDSRIKVIHKQNAGLGMARNTGIENATGNYIYFCDSDDYIHPKTIEQCYQTAKSEQADLVLFGFQMIDKYGNIKQACRTAQKEVYRDNAIHESFIPDMIGPDPITGKCIGLWMSIAMCFYSMELIRTANWKCASEREIISEDMFSLLCLYPFVKCAVVLPDAFYNYCENPMSLSRIYRSDRFGLIKKFYTECLKACERYHYSEKIQNRIAVPFVNYTIAAMKQLVICHKPFSEKFCLLKEIVNDEMFHSVLLKNRHTKVNLQKKILFFFINKKQYFISYLLLKIKQYPAIK